MSERRRSAATATVGLAGVGGAAALRHESMVRAYDERTSTPRKRPPFGGEIRMVKHPKGRKIWLAGAGLGALSIPAAATGVHGVLHPKKQVASKRSSEERPFWREGVVGAKDAVVDRTRTVSQGSPPKLVAGNYAAGAAVGTGVSGLTHLALRKKKIPGHAKTALAAIGGATVGTAMLPLQSKATEKLSRGRYVVTPTGVRAKKTKAQRPSSKASIYDARTMPAAQFRQSTVGKMSPRDLPAYAGARWTVGSLKAAERLEPAKAAATRKGRLVATGKTKASRALRAAATSPESATTLMMRHTVHGHPLFGKRDIGAGMSRNERRARVTAAGVPVPIVGDIMQAHTAARYAAPGNKARAAATNFAGGQSGQVAGMGLGAGAALGAARLSPAFDRKAQRASDKVDSVTNAARSKVGLKPPGKSLLTRGLEHKATPKAVRTAVGRAASSGLGRAVARNPKVAAIGALAGGQVGGIAGQQTAYGRVMDRDDRIRARRDAAVARRVHKATATGPVPLSSREREKLARRKRHSAAMSVFGGATGIAALGATLGEKALSDKRVKERLRGTTWAKPLRGRLKAVQVPLITAGAGVGGINAFTGAKVQRTEAQQIRKGVAIRLRKPAMRRGYLRQVRVPGGAVRTSTVRGGLG